MCAWLHNLVHVVVCVYVCVLLFLIEFIWKDRHINKTKYIGSANSSNCKLLINVNLLWYYLFNLCLLFISSLPFTTDFPLSIYPLSIFFIRYCWRDIDCSLLFSANCCIYFGLRYYFKLFHYHHSKEGTVFGQKLFLFFQSVYNLSKSWNSIFI